jgi:hypothetical protein
MHQYILKNRDLCGLPRKSNIAYDSGGRVSVCADTNDIGFYAVKVTPSTIGNRSEAEMAEGNHSSSIRPGIYFRMQLCGITGHKQLATDCGVLLTPAGTIPVAAALIRPSSKTSTAPTARKPAVSRRHGRLRPPPRPTAQSLALLPRPPHLLALPRNPRFLPLRAQPRSFCRLPLSPRLPAEIFIGTWHLPSASPPPSPAP